MAPGASIGAATVVVGTTGQAAPDKYQSYMRSIMRSTAEANGRDPKIAEAMVDEEIEIDSITEAGKVLTFSTSEAIKTVFVKRK
jgi:membrane-bound serine protease (ClpP class)